MSTRAATSSNSLLQQCCICLDSMVAPVLTPCGHRFCEGCILTSLKHSKTCPTCRSPIRNHRLLRADTLMAELLGSTPHAMDGDDSGEPVGDDSWDCTTCTLANPLAAGRCMACGARRPTRAAPPPTRTSFAMLWNSEMAENA